MFQGEDIEFLEQMHQLKEIAKIGEGSFGRVYKALDLTDQQVVAVKVVSKTLFKDAQSESDIYQMLHHPNIVHCKRISDNKSHYYFVMELMQGGTLHTLMQLGPLGDEDAATLMRGILSGVSYLHHKRIIHRDLKPENIMLANQDLQSVKIADFGLSFRHSQEGAFYSLMNKKCGTILYMAPEQFKEKYYSKQVDSWSCGIILHMLLTGGLHPFYCKTDSKESTIKRITQGQWKLPENASQLAKDLLQKLTLPNPTERYSVGQALIHPWITRKFEDKIPLTYNQQINQFLHEQQLRKIMKTMVFLSYIARNSESHVVRVQPDFIIESDHSEKRSEIKSDKKSTESNLNSSHSKIQKIIVLKNNIKLKNQRVSSPTTGIKAIDLQPFRKQSGQRSFENLNHMETTQFSFRSTQEKPKLGRQQVRPQTIELLPSQKHLGQKQQVVTRRRQGLPPLLKKK